MRKFIIEPADAGGRTDKFVAGKYPQFSRSALERLFDFGHITIAGEPAKPAHKLKIGEVIEVNEKNLASESPDIDLPVIYEDDDVVVIDKPAGVLTHSKGALNLEASVASFISNRLHDKSLTGNRAGIVHRLDRDTSGVIITAKSAKAMDALQKQFAKRKAAKTYLAIVEGQPEPAKAIIDAPIMRNPAKPQTFRVGALGRKAQTEYETLGSFEVGGRKYSLLKLMPKTGRTHQLRVHMAYIHHPIAGDRVYGRNGMPLMLHASSLELTLPNGKRQKFIAPTPKRIKEFPDA